MTLLKYPTVLLIVSSTLTLRLLLCSAPAHSDSEAVNVYGSISAQNYLTGKFEPGQHPHFVSLNSLGFTTNSKELYLRTEAAMAFLNLYQAFRDDNPRTPLWVQSATQTWDTQKQIWENKWNGNSLVDGRKLTRTHPDRVKRVLKVMEHSAIPGASRHHWGTELDFNILENEYYEAGDGAILYKWLQKNARRYDFCQPYKGTRNVGHGKEPWHWSYRPLASRFRREWTRLFENNVKLLLRSGGFDGFAVASELVPQYIKNVNPRCD